MIVRPTCTLCYNEGKINFTFSPAQALCTNHYNEWSATGTYREETVTGTFNLPEWVRIFSAYHHNEERLMYHSEMTFSDLLDEEAEKGKGSSDVSLFPDEP